MALDLFASDSSSLFQASSRSDRERPGAGTYSWRPYVRSLVCTSPKSVVASCFSVTHVLFVVCLYDVKSVEKPFASVYDPVKAVADHLAWISDIAESN